MSVLLDITNKTQLQNITQTIYNFCTHMYIKDVLLIVIHLYTFFPNTAFKNTIQLA